MMNKGINNKNVNENFSSFYTFVYFRYLKTLGCSIWRHFQGNLNTNVFFDKITKIGNETGNLIKINKISSENPNLLPI